MLDKKEEYSTRILNDAFVVTLELPDDITQAQSDGISRKIDELNEAEYKER